MWEQITLLGCFCASLYGSVPSKILIAILYKFDTGKHEFID